MGRPHMKDEEKMRVLYLFAEAFRQNPAITIWKATSFVAKQISEETGHTVSSKAALYVYNNQEVPLPERVPHKRKGAPTKVSDELEEQVAFILADPDVPQEMKSLRKMKQLLPDFDISSTTLARLFKKLKKDKLLPKTGDQGAKRRATGGQSGAAPSGRKKKANEDADHATHEAAEATDYLQFSMYPNH